MKSSSDDGAGLPKLIVDDSGYFEQTKNEKVFVHDGTEGGTAALKAFLREVAKVGSGVCVFEMDNGKQELVIERPRGAAERGAPGRRQEVPEGVGESGSIFELLDGPEMLTAIDMAHRMQILRKDVHIQRKAGRILAVSGGGRQQKYPDWQLGANNEPLEGVAELISMLGQGWPTLNFLLSNSEDGRTFIQRLAAGDKESVISAARRQTSEAPAN